MASQDKGAPRAKALAKVAAKLTDKVLHANLPAPVKVRDKVASKAAAGAMTANAMHAKSRQYRTCAASRNR